MKVSRLSHTKQLILNLLWFPLNAETAALLTIVIPTQILLFVPSSQVSIAGGHGHIEPGYRLVFACATVFLIIAAIGILFVREPG